MAVKEREMRSIVSSLLVKLIRSIPDWYFFFVYKFLMKSELNFF